MRGLLDLGTQRIEIPLLRTHYFCPCCGRQTVVQEATSLTADDPSHHCLSCLSEFQVLNIVTGGSGTVQLLEHEHVPDGATQEYVLLHPIAFMPGNLRTILPAGAVVYDADTAHLAAVVVCYDRVVVLDEKIGQVSANIHGAIRLRPSLLRFGRYSLTETEARSRLVLTQKFEPICPM